MANRYDEHVAKLLNAAVLAAMTKHPRGSSAAIWAARQAIEDMCAETLVAPVQWATARRGQISLRGDVYSFNIPGEVA